ncbi:MAG: 2-C-methyl-D-erythritol 4-phosphate cytidylyltransferase [Oscillospiraceae bacterium]|nr:2-C-methyl-D-erythritol 4-phosphate cytidylyltransferase [Oscillospiraceae bacterium]
MNIFKKLRKDKVPKEPHCSAVIVAAGSSERMGSDKMSLMLGGKPVLARTLKVFQDSPLVDEIIVVSKIDRLQETADLCKEYGIEKISRVVAGGKTRTESALVGVSEVDPKARLIAIHDGARPLVTEDLILRTVYAASEHMAAAPVVSSPDTLKAVDADGFMLGTVDRETTLRVQTPQVFRAEIIKGALTKAVEKGLVLTDDCAAAEMMGVRTKTVLGDDDNIKITRPRDMLFAEEILKERGEAL